MVNTARRKQRQVSSTATRVYQGIEWCLILATNLEELLESSSNPSRSNIYGYIIKNVNHYILAIAVLTVILTYESRSRWTSLLLYIVVFPISIARRKCLGGVNQPDASGMFSTSVHISTISYLHSALQYFRPLGDWTPVPSDTLHAYGCFMSPEESLTSILHVHIIQLGQSLAEHSLNTIELSLLAQALTTFTVYYSRRHLLSKAPFQETFFIAFLYGLLISVYASALFLKKNVKLAKMKPQFRPKNALRLRYTYALYAYLTISVVILTLVRTFLLQNLGHDPFLYLAKYFVADTRRMLLLAYWALVTGTGIIVVVYFWGSKPVGGLSGFPYSALRLLKHTTKHDQHQSEAEDEVFFEGEDTLARRARALDRRRKFFHGLVVVLFLPTMNQDPVLSYLALALVFTAFIFEEVLRVTVLPPFGLAINKFLSGFTDHRDKAGHLVVSHLFLLVGVAAPVWLTLTGESATNLDLVPARKSIAMLSGVLTLGAGDAAASIVGKKFGRHKWPASKKSVEGTIAFVFAMMLGGLVTQYTSTLWDAVLWKRFALGVVATGIMEAVSTQNDNLIIPIFMWCLIF